MTNLDLSTLVLHKGSHEDSPLLCVMEATAVWLGENKKDHGIDAVCPRIEVYARVLNDTMPHEERQRLIAFIPRLPNTKPRTEAQDLARRWMLQETATKLFAASAMRAAGLTEQADKLSRCVVTDSETSRFWAAEAAEAARAAEVAWAEGAALAALAAGAAGAVWAADAAGMWDESINLLDRLIKVTEEAA